MKNISRNRPTDGALILSIFLTKQGPFCFLRVGLGGGLFYSFPLFILVHSDLVPALQPPPATSNFTSGPENPAVDLIMME
jgi:hypothetical protein